MRDSLSNHSDAFLKERKISMPQMCIDGLSENWLFKFLGANHWEMLCKGLGKDSTELQNAEGERLYASFVRIRIEASETINSFQENENIQLYGNIKRYGNEMYFSDFSFQSNQNASKKINAKLITIFSIRESNNNQKLMRSEVDFSNCKTPALDSMPEFGIEYRKIKMQKVGKITLKDYDFAINEEVLFETEYQLNSYYDVNGVGLIYFAAYPTISDSCESRFFNQKERQSTIRWEQQYFTLARDVMYYANCELTDTIHYQLNKVEKVKDSLVKITSSLYRKSDKMLMAKIYTLKQLKAL